MQENPSEQEVVSKVLKSLETEFTTFLQSYTRLSRKRLSNINKNTIYDLRIELNSLQIKIQEAIQNNPEVPEQGISLSDIFQECQKMCINLQTLSSNTEKIKNQLLKLGKDAKSDSKLEIFTVKVKVKNEAANWVIEVRPSVDCTECFRNVKIIEVETNHEVACFLLVEPLVTLKKKIDYPLTPMNHLVAKIENKVVSDPFFIPKVKILAISPYDQGFAITLQNLSSENMMNFNLVDGFCNQIGQYTNLSPYQKSMYSFMCSSYGLVKIYVELDGVLLSQAFELTIQQEDFESNFAGFSENARNIARVIRDQYPALNSQSLLSAFQFGEDYNEIITYLRRNGEIN